MDENNENTQNADANENLNTEEAKNEAKENIPEVKENVKNEDNKDQSKTQNNEQSKNTKEVKNSNFKKEADAAKNFFANFFKTPYTEMKKIVESPKSFMKIAIVVFIVWVVVELIGGIISVFRTFSYSSYSTLDMFVRNSIKDFFSVIWNVLNPTIIVALLSFIIYLLMKNNKKNYLTIVYTIITAKIPVILASIVSLLGINSALKNITGSFSSICSVVSTVLVYFAIKALYNEDDDNKVAKAFLITMSIYYGILLIFKFFNLYI